MTDTAQTLKGFRDFLGENAYKRKWLINKIEGVFSSFGFEPLETPALEYASLLTGKYGDEAEQLIYKFKDRGDREVALRYDQTVPTARVVAQYQHEIVFPYKRYQIQPVWRADKPQRGRYREFFQCDADIIGSDSYLADAEIVAVYYEIHRAIGLDSFFLKINDRELLISTISGCGVPDEKVLPAIQTIDKLGKKTEDEVIQELTTKGIEASTGQEILRKLSESTPSERLQKIKDAAVLLGVPEEKLVFDATLARGLDYYTGLIFEGIVPEYEVGSVGGGGRYDNLINNLVGVDKPAVGFGLGFDRTLEAAEILNVIPPLGVAKVLITIFSPELTKESMDIALLLRRNGVSVELYTQPEDKLEKQLKYASKKNIGHVVIVGPDEAASRSVVVKDMTKGTQEAISQDKLIEHFSHGH